MTLRIDREVKGNNMRHVPFRNQTMIVNSNNILIIRRRHDVTSGRPISTVLT